MFVYDTHQPQVLEADAYVSETQHERELERLFLPAWHFVGTVNDIPNNGDYLTTNRLGRPLIVWNRGGVVRTFLNVCAHRFACLRSDECGNQMQLVCQYHGWEYDASGKTKKIPDARSFRPLEKGTLGLAPVRTELCGQLIFVTFDDGAPDLETFIGGIWERMRSLFGEERRDVLSLDYELEANWKIKIENTVESYHVDMVHPTTFGKTPPAEDCNEQLEENWTSFLTVQDSERASERFLDRLLHRLARVEQDFQYAHYLVYPHIMFAKLRMFSWIETVFPIAPQRHRIVQRIFCDPGHAGFRSEIVYRLMRVHGRRMCPKIVAEDSSVITAVQQGLASAERPNGGLLSVREERCFHFQNYVKRETHTEAAALQHESSYES
jgi:phenylpropionate dioxygenase-like ring-hydroxylating dioxygenase large terminal subunit